LRRSLCIPIRLLSQITTASTNPQEILDVDNWLQQNPDLTGPALTDAAQKQGFDPAFIALVSFPNVLAVMAEHVDDYAAIGNAFSADQGAVTASIQRLRDQAYATGALRSNSQQQVEVQQAAGQPIYIIQPANPQGAARTITIAGFSTNFSRCAMPREMLFAGVAPGSTLKNCVYGEWSR
jgi:hypothetical protein